ncbi:unnamed protein product, partial [Oppiella nova]
MSPNSWFRYCFRCDKLTVVDDYIRGHEKTHGFEFVKFLDKCIVDRSIGDAIGQQIPHARRDKMDPKMLTKLVARLLKQHRIDESACPNIVSQRNGKQLKYLLYKRFIEGGFSDGSWREIIINTVADNKELQEELIYQVVSYGDYNDAFKWAQHFDIPVDRRPHCILNMTESAAPVPTDSWDGWGDEDLTDNYHSLKLSLLDSVVWVNNDLKFGSFIKHITEGYQIIGIDGEWPPSLGSNAQKLSILQIASCDSCHIIDILNLNQSQMGTIFTEQILNSKSIIKLGFGIHNDLSLIKESFNMSTNFRPQNVLDLSKFMEYILSEFTDLIADTVIAEARRNDLKGLSKTVFILLGKALNKSEQFSDWNRRPLREDQVKYAALD